MRLTKRTYSLPGETVERFEAHIAPGRRSALVAELMDSWIRERDRIALRSDVVEGCKAMAQLNQATVLEWEAADDALWRTIAP